MAYLASQSAGTPGVIGTPLPMESVRLGEGKIRQRAVFLGSQSSPEGILLDEMESFVLKVKRFCTQSKSLEMLYVMALCVTEELNEHEYQRLEWLQDLARKKIWWPVVRTPTHASEVASKQFLKNIGFAEAPDGPLDTKMVLKIRLPAQEWAYEAYKFICVIRYTHGIRDATESVGTKAVGADSSQSPQKPNYKRVRRTNAVDRTGFINACLELPPITKETVQQWEDVVELYVRFETGNRPEKIPELKKLGEHEATHTETSKLGSKTSNSNIRYAITEAVGKGFRALLKKELKSSSKRGA